MFNRVFGPSRKDGEKDPQVMWPTPYGWERGDPDPSESIEDAEGVLGVDIDSDEISFDPSGAWTDEQITSWNAAGQPPGMTQAQAQQLADQAITDSESKGLGYGKGYDLSQEGLGYGWSGGESGGSSGGGDDEGLGYF